MNTYSREFLQTYRQNFQTINFCEQIEKQVLQKALSNETRFVYPVHSKKYPIGNGEYIQIDNVVSMLKIKFPNCLIEYQEVKNIQGKVESGIVIDWS